MIIITLIISCLTLIAVSVGLFLTHKSTRNILLTIANFETTLNKNVENSKNDIIAKSIEIYNSTVSKFDASKNEIQNVVKECDTNSHNAITSAKNTILESLEPKVVDLKTETAQYLQKLSTEVNSKIDAALQAQEQRHTDLINEVKEKFGKIIDEIKSPLTLD